MDKHRKSHRSNYTYMASPMHTCTNALQVRRLAKFVELGGNMDKKEEQMELCRAEGKMKGRRKRNRSNIRQVTWKLRKCH